MLNVLFPKAAVACELPRDIEFQICTPSEEPPEGDGWLHQAKHDGWRVFVTIDDRGELFIGSRNGYDYTGEFALPVRGLAALGRSMIVDGEIAVPNREGLTHLDWLQEARRTGRPDRLALFAFDLLYLDGFDLRRCPIEERIAMLDHLITEAGCARVLSVGHVIGGGAEFFDAARCQGAEGIVSKRLGKPYLAGDSPHWLKTKVNATGRFLVTGYETELGKLKAIHVAEEREGEVRPQGRVKFGLRGLFDRLQPWRTGYRAARDGVQPVRPGLWVDVKYFGRIARGSGKIPGGSLRDGVVTWFETEQERRGRLARWDAATLWSCDTPEILAAMAKQPPDGAIEAAPRQSRVPRAPAVKSRIVVPAAEPAVRPENIQRLLDDAVVPSRDDLLAHWRAVGELALEYLAHRPLTLVRHVAGLTFFHEGAVPSLTAGVRQMTYTKRRNGETGYRVWIEDLAGLLGLVEMGVVEVHPWSSRIDDIEHPDSVVLDLDPDPNLEWSFVVETALRVRDLFAAHDLPTWPKLTGGKGLHITASIEPALTFEQTRAFVRSVAERLAATAPDRYTTSSSLALRPGRIYRDYARNGLGATAVGCYSPRARHGFPVAMPVTWEEVERGMRPNAFSVGQFAAPRVHVRASSRRPSRAERVREDVR